MYPNTNFRSAQSSQNKTDPDWDLLRPLDTLLPPGLMVQGQRPPTALFPPPTPPEQLIACGEFTPSRVSYNSSNPHKAAEVRSCQLSVRLKTDFHDYEVPDKSQNPQATRPSTLNMANPPKASPAIMLSVDIANPGSVSPAMASLATPNLATVTPAMVNLATLNPATVTLAMVNPATVALTIVNLAAPNPAVATPAIVDLPVPPNPATVTRAMVNLATPNLATIMVNLATSNMATPVPPPVVNTRK
ncbi:hypothetical protein SCLCIDRAFT_6327 [Scleroderma citrinum Foug A]|uniref:Uncharacterized protein n=1 Tax=Scleroderma citrinum Foug A TaxID=1036808 RepID=A0A0C3AAP0_9AGAM|nr:hypothetical protein SCLCIDRAFT_6327 [Scleroderma citrinum Foug A]